MHPAIRSFTGLVSAGAIVGAVLFGGPSPAVAASPTVTVTVTGEIPATIIRNQFLYCNLICPYLLQGVTTVPIAAVQSPGVLATAYGTTGSVPRATGIAANSVTRPAHAAMTGIIVNDLTLVLPRAQNALTVAVVEGLDITGAQDLDIARTRILDALNQPITPNPPSTAIATTEAQVSVVDGINAASALLFQAPELLLLGATATADAAATELAGTGDVNSARAVGDAHAAYWINQAQSVLQTSAR